eukprot:jgi/Chrpa1/20614/Chrysochromulina_OHIO_Genome00026547-RA
MARGLLLAIVAVTVSAQSSPPPPILCSETCNFASDVDCDDGGPGSDFNACTYGTDCTDCGPRVPRSPPPPAVASPPQATGTLCNDLCVGFPTYASDGFCDDGGPGAEFPDCQYGTDCTDCGPRVPLAPPPSVAPPSTPLCTETCVWASDADCDDGGPGAEFTSCALGTDCTDCGPRVPLAPPSTLPPPSTTLCTETCVYSSDADCDDGGPGSEFPLCALGTDCTDCGPRTPLAPPPSATLCNDLCVGFPMYASDGFCDDGGPGAEFPDCQYGTDCTDCGPRTPLAPPSTTLCTETCVYASDADCDDGGPGSEFPLCALGTDCADCGPRQVLPPPPFSAPRAPSGPRAPPSPSAPGLCQNTCVGFPTYASDGDCDDGGPGAEFADCVYGTDCADCGVRPFPPPAPICTNACIGFPTYASDGFCDDGGPGAEFPDCQYGTDCADCGPRAPRMPPPPPLLLCAETCTYTSDDDCDDGGPGSEFPLCAIGTDCADCGPRVPPPPPVCTETCNYASDNDCDDGGPGSEFPLCALGTDCIDCGPRVPSFKPPPPPLPPAICSE